MSRPPPGLSVALQVNPNIVLLHVDSTQATLGCLQCSHTRVELVQLQLQCLGRWRAPAPLKCEKYANCYESVRWGTAGKWQLAKHLPATAPGLRSALHSMKRQTYYVLKLQMWTETLFFI